MEQRKLIKLKGETKEMSCSEVYEQFNRFIYKTAHGFLNTGEDIDDLIQVANIGLVKAFNSYKVESKNLFMTYLAIVVNNQVLMHLRKIKKFRNETSFDDPLCTDIDGNSLTLLEIIKDPEECEEIVFKKIADIELKKFINELRPLNKRILELFFFGNMKQFKIGKELNISQSYVSRLLVQSLKTLKNKYERNGCFMSKKEDCFKIFYAHSDATRDKVIELAMDKTGVSKATAWTYYPAWRKEFMSTPNYITLDTQMKEKLKNNTEKTVIIPKAADKITEVAEKSPIEVVNIPEPKSIKWKEDVLNPVEVKKEKENIFEITRLVPVVMQGKYGEYQFAKEGVKNISNEDFISKDKMDEALEALEIWERCYENGSTQVC